MLKKCVSDIIKFIVLSIILMFLGYYLKMSHTPLINDVIDNSLMFIYGIVLGSMIIFKNVYCTKN